MLHLVRRFLWSLWWSLRPRPPDPVDDAWARGHLRPSEEALWDRMVPLDQRHAVAVARRVDADPRVPEAEREAAVGAALLHDVGKVTADLGTIGRSVATAAEWVVSDETAHRWAEARGRRGDVGRYLTYPEAGAALLREAGSTPLAVAWAREHHRPPDEWTVDRLLGEALAAADR